MYETAEAKSHIILYSFLKMFICVIFFNVLNFLIELKWQEQSKTIRITIHSFALLVFIMMVCMKKIVSMDISDLPVFFILVPMLSTLIKAAISYSACGYCITQIRIILRENLTEAQRKQSEEQLDILYKDPEKYFTQTMHFFLFSIGPKCQTKCKKYLEYIKNNYKSIENFDARIFAIIDIVKFPFILVDQIPSSFLKYLCFLCIVMFLLYFINKFLPESIVFFAIYFMSGFLGMSCGKLGEKTTDLKKAIDICLCSLMCGDLYEGIKTTHKKLPRH